MPRRTRSPSVRRPSLPRSLSCALIPPNAAKSVAGKRMRTLLGASVFGDVLSPVAAFAMPVCHEDPDDEFSLGATEQATW